MILHFGPDLIGSAIRNVGGTPVGVLLQRRGKLAEAETWYRRAVNAGHADVGDREVMTRLGVLLQRRGELEEAETWYRRAAKARDREAMTHLGVLLQRRGKLGEAETWYRRAANAGHGEAMHSLGVLLQQRGRLEEAETWYRRAAEAGDSRAMHNLGVLLGLRGELGEAETWCRRAAAGGHTEAMFNLAVRLVERGRWDEAATLVRAGGPRRSHRGDVQPGVAAAARQPGRGAAAAGRVGWGGDEAETWYRRAGRGWGSGRRTRLLWRSCASPSPRTSRRSRPGLSASGSLLVRAVCDVQIWGLGVAGSAAGSASDRWRPAVG